MTPLILLRHAQTAWSADSRLQGRADLPLSGQGRRQAQTWRLPAPVTRGARPVTSPLRRARETAAAMGLPARSEPALTEMDWGRWEGRILAELRRADPVGMARREARGLDFRPPDGESYRDVATRLRPWFGAVAAAGQPVVAVTHKGVITVCLALATGWDMTTPRPARLQDGCWHGFLLGPGGRLAVDRLNQAFSRI